jgi:hypothetical protein
MKDKHPSKLNHFDEELLMTPNVIQVTVLQDYKLQVHFENGELKIFDMSSYLQYPAFSDLSYDNLFARAKVLNGTVVWTDEIDISPDTLYLKGETINSSESIAELIPISI